MIGPLSPGLVPLKPRPKNGPIKAMRPIENKNPPTFFILPPNDGYVYTTVKIIP
jgi:hypothetical protein